MTAKETLVTSRRVRRALASALALTFLAAACGGSDNADAQSKTEGSTGTTAERAAAKSYKVGVILPLTGPGAAIGKDFQLGLETFREVDPEAAKLDIEYVVCDDKTTPDGAAACARKLSTEDGVQMIYGPVLSGPHAGAAPVLASGPPSVTPSPYVKPQPGTPIYSVAGSSFDLDRTNLLLAKERGYDKLAVLATTDLTGQTAVDNIEEANKEIGLDVSIERMGPTDVDATAQLNRLLGGKPDAIYIAASGAAAGVGLKGLAQLQSRIPVFIIWSNTTKGFLDAAKPAWPTEALYALPASWLPDSLNDKARAEQVRRFQEAFQAKAGAPVSFVVQGGYDAFQLIVAALEKTGGDRRAIIEYLDSLKDFQGLNWKLSYSKDNHVGPKKGNYVVMKYDAATGTWSLAES